MFKKCGGSSQSPIDIVTADADMNDKLNEFIFDNYDDPLEGAIIENNGHTSMYLPLLSYLLCINSFINSWWYCTTIFFSFHYDVTCSYT